jgi:hypothetical protein
MADAFSRKLARAEYEAKHWGSRGGRGPERLRVADGKGNLVLLGDLIQVVYRTRKADDEPEGVDYEHEFKRPHPRLAYDSHGLLVIAGGTYRISDRGIIG